MWNDKLFCRIDYRFIKVFLYFSGNHIVAPYPYNLVKVKLDPVCFLKFKIGREYFDYVSTYAEISTVKNGVIPLVLDLRK